MEQPEAFDQLQRHLNASAGKPTFDEWYMSKFGQTFESQWQTGEMPIYLGLNALSRALRDYVTEMVR